MEERIIFEGEIMYKVKISFKFLFFFTNEKINLKRE